MDQYQSNISGIKQKIIPLGHELKLYHSVVARTIQVSYKEREVLSTVCSSSQPYKSKKHQRRDGDRHVSCSSTVGDSIRVVTC